MNPRSFIVLVLLTLLTAGAAWYTTQRRTPETEITHAALFPGLNQHVNDVAKIEVKDKTHSAVVVQKDGNWVVENRSGYPALVESVKKAVLGTAEMKIIEAKTSNKELYSKLGVEDVEAENSASKLMSFSDKSGKPVASLIVGKNRTATGPGSSALYVRKPGEAQAVLVEGDLNVSTDTADWLDKEILNIDGNRIRDVVIEQPNEKPVHVYRKDSEAKDLTVDNIPAGHKAKSQFTVNSLATALENLRLDDVAARSAVNFPKDLTTTVRYQTFDGLRGTASVAKIDNKTHVALDFQFDAEAAKKNLRPTATPAPTPTSVPAGTPAGTPTPTAVPTPNPLAPEAVEKESNALQTKVGQWVYIVPDYKANLFIKKLSDLAGPPEPDKAKSAKKAGTAPDAEPPPEIPPESVLKGEALPPHSHSH